MTKFNNYTMTKLIKTIYNFVFMLQETSARTFLICQALR